MTDSYDFTDLPLHGRFTEDGTQFRLYTSLNGVEFPVEYYNVHDHREKLDEAVKAGETTSEAE